MPNKRPLLSSSTPPSKRRKQRVNWVTLLDAAKEGDLRTVQTLIEAGVDVNCAGVDGVTALIGAAACGHTEVVQALLAAGAKVNHADVDGVTALVAAFKNNHAAVVRALVNVFGVDLNGADKRGVTVLIWAAQRGETELVQTLMSLGANVNSHDFYGDGAIMHALEKGHQEVAKILVNAGMFDVNHINQDKVTPLMWAAKYGFSEIAQTLIAKEARLNLKDSFGTTALMYAAEYGQVELVNLLVASGALVNIEDDNERTALLWAAEKGHVETVRALLDACAEYSVDLEVSAEQIFGLICLHKQSPSLKIIASVTQILDRFKHLVNDLSLVDDALISAPQIQAIMQEHAVSQIQGPYRNDLGVAAQIGCYMGWDKLTRNVVTSTARAVQSICRENTRLRMQLACVSSEIERLNSRLLAEVIPQREEIKHCERIPLTGNRATLFSATKHVGVSEQIQLLESRVQ